MMNSARLEVARAEVASDQGPNGRRISVIVGRIWRFDSHDGCYEGVVTHYLVPAH